VSRLLSERKLLFYLDLTSAQRRLVQAVLSPDVFWSSTLHNGLRARSRPVDRASIATHGPRHDGAVRISVCESDTVKWTAHTPPVNNVQSSPNAVASALHNQLTARALKRSPSLIMDYGQSSLQIFVYLCTWTKAELRSFSHVRTFIFFCVNQFNPMSFMYYIFLSTVGADNCSRTFGLP